MQEYEDEMERLKEEIRKLRETENEKIKQLEEEKQRLEAAAKYSAEQLDVLNAKKVRTLTNFICTP